ncbi:CvpA family protein [Caldicellulosiruptoraceae bacterium PP1]
MINQSDIIFLIIIGIGAIIGYKKGLLRMLFDFGSYIISWFIALIGYKIVSSILLSSKPIKDALYKFVSDKVILKNEVMPTVPELFKSSIEQANNAINKTLQDAAVVILANFLAIIITFFLAKIAIMIIKNTFGFLRKVPILGTIDGTGGLIAGIAIALMFTYIFLAIIYFFPNAEIFKGMQANIKKSMFVEILYNNNVVVNLLKGYIKV